jgi:hypothetical protein
MLGIQKRPAPNEVFTPRSPEVNVDMYVRRPDLERRLMRAVDSTQHLLIFGESGNGKTWLYKEHFKSRNIAFRTVDLSIAITEGLSSALIKSLNDEGWSPVKRIVTGEAGAKLYVAHAGGAIQTEYSPIEVSPLDAILQELNAESAGAKFLVFDNFEQVSTQPETLKEIASLIIRLDNSQFSKQGTRFLFVGVVADMKELIAHYDQAGTIANRVTELPEVKRLTEKEAETLVVRGLFEKLKIETELPKQEVVDRISFLTDRIAQQLHEFCYQVACEARDTGWKLTKEGLDQAENDWIDTSLSLYKAHIESRMNKRETRIQRRNQVLFSLAMLESDAIRANDVDALVRKLFPKTVSAKKLGIDQILEGLSEGKNPILIRNPNESTYRISHPKLRPAIRVRLKDLGRESDQLPLTRDQHIDFATLLETLQKAMSMDLDQNLMVKRRPDRGTPQ